MTYRRQLVLAYLGTAMVVVVAVNSALSFVLVALSLVALGLGYGRRSSPSVAVAGILLYQPLAVVLTFLIPGLWSYVASALILVVLSERLSFEYQLSSVLDSPAGTDEESRVLAERLSKSHARVLIAYAIVAAGVSSLSPLASGVVFYSSVLAVASILLMLVLWTNSRR